MKKQFLTVLIFTKINTKRFFRDKLAIFFGFLFPLIFLFVFGSLSNGNNNVSFNIAVINQSSSNASVKLVKSIDSQKVFKINKTITTLFRAKQAMINSQIDATILLNKNFGQVLNNHLPTGTVSLLYSQNSNVAGQTIASLMQQSILKRFNAKYIKYSPPFTVKSQQLNDHSLTAFDYTFAGLLGFSIIGIAIFGPVNVFPELKKQGILRRLHTTPLKVWQYFISTMLSQAIIGLFSVGLQFLVAVSFFHLKINGNLVYIAIFTIFSIFMILGLGLAIGGWAKNERQAAPLSNIIVFPMLFLSGTFFPRFEMPIWLQKITTYLPLTPVIDGLRLLTTENKSLFQIGPQIGLVFAWFIIIYIVAFRVFRWE